MDKEWLDKEYLEKLEERLREVYDQLNERILSLDSTLDEKTVYNQDNISSL